MRQYRRHPRLVLVVLGVLSILTGYVVSGELFQGYSQSGGAVLVHAGVFALLLAGTMSVCAKVPLRADQNGIVAAVGALIALYPLAVGFIWYDLVVTPPPYYGGEPTLVDMARNRLGFVLALAPLTAGLIAGAFVSTPPEKRSVVVPVLASAFAVGGPALGYQLAVIGGAHPGFAKLLYVLLAFSVGVGSLPLYVIARWEYDDTTEGDPGSAGLSPA